jgi:hypothetical protein
MKSKISLDKMHLIGYTKAFTPERWRSDEAMQAMWGGVSA